MQDVVTGHEGKTSALNVGDSDVPLNNRRPLIESHLGHYPDTDVEDAANNQRDDYWLEDDKTKHAVPADGSHDDLSELMSRRSVLEVCSYLL